METRKITIDKTINRDEIKATMDFDKLINKYSTVSKFRSLTKKIIGGMIATTAIVATLILGEHFRKDSMVSFADKNKIGKEEITSGNTNENQSHQLAADTQNICFTRSEDAMRKSSSDNHTYHETRYNSLCEFYKTNALKSQLFTIMSSRDTAITGEQGTKLFIKANSFVDMMDKPVEGEIDIELKECYKLDDMLKENLTTLSDNKVLETGGMVYIGAKSNFKELKLKQFTDIEMANPLAEVMADTSMLLFYGKRNEQSYDINWTIDKFSRVPYPVATLTGGKSHNSTTIDYFANHFRFEKGRMIKCLKNKDSLNFSVSLDELKKVIGFSGGSLEGPGTALYEFIQLFNKNIPTVNSASWETGFQFKVFNEPVYRQYVKEYERYMKDSKIHKERQLYFHESKDNISYATITPRFYIGKIGWVNCDRFMQPTISVNTIQLKMNPDASENVKLILHPKIWPSIIKPTKLSESRLWVFPNIPVNQEVIIMGTILKDGQIYKSSNTIKVNKEEPIREIEYQPSL